MALLIAVEFDVPLRPSIKAEETEKIALMQRYRQAIKPTVARLSQLIATLA